MKVLVTGGRTYNDPACVDRYLTQIAPSTIVHGGAKGADSLAESWALQHGVRSIAYYAQWNLHGKRAGPLRNQKMLDAEKPDLVLAFPGGIGTEDMVRRAEAAGVHVIRAADKR